MNEKPIKLEITIDASVGLAAWVVKRVVNCGLFIFMIMAIPVGNHVYLGGGWALDLIGGFLGLLIGAAAISVDNVREQC